LYCNVSYLNSFQNAVIRE